MDHAAAYGWKKTDLRLRMRKNECKERGRERGRWEGGYSRGCLLLLLLSAAEICNRAELLHRSQPRGSNGAKGHLTQIEKFLPQGKVAPSEAP